MLYKKSQTGWFMIIIFTVILVFLTFAYIYQLGNRPLPKPAFITLALVFILLLLSFYKLTLKVNDSILHVIYGIGLIHFRFQLQKVLEIKEIKIPAYIGVGIRITSKGMLYNIQGNKALELTYHDNELKKIKIGTNDGPNLKAAILAQKALINQISQNIC